MRDTVEQALAGATEDERCDVQVPLVDETCRLLEESGVAVRSEGALCVFFDDVKGPDGNPTPLIVKKSNGGYGYAATDLSAIRDRVQSLGANTLRLLCTTACAAGRISFLTWIGCLVSLPPPVTVSRPSVRLGSAD